MHIPYFSIQNLFQQYGPQINRIAQEVWSSGSYFDEALTSEFEQVLAESSLRKYAVTVGSCTDALFFSLKALDVQAGDRVLVPAVSFIATVTPVLRSGAIPIFCDIVPETGLADLNHVETLIKRHQPKVAMLVDLYGNLFEPSDIHHLEAQYDIPFLLDAAQSIGAVRSGAKAGSVGRMSCFSFDPTKVIHGFGSGGAVLTDDPGLAARVRSLRYHGKVKKEHLEPGYNSRMNTLQIELLHLQLSQLSTIVNDRNETAVRFLQALQHAPSITPLSSQNDLQNFHKFVVLCNDRALVQSHLESKGIQSMVHYPQPLFFHPLFEKVPFIAENIDAAPAFCGRVLSLPLHPFMDPDQVAFLCQTLKELK